MRLSRYSDYLVRVLMYTALRRPERVTVSEVAQTFSISRHHLVKAVHDLGRNDYLVTRRGVGGGFTLAREPHLIRLGNVIRLGEEETVIRCTDGVEQICRLAGACRLKEVLDEAAGAFFDILDRYTLADLVEKSGAMKNILGLQAQENCNNEDRKYRSQ